jgi:hypothetical protein
MSRTYSVNDHLSQGPLSEPDGDFKTLGQSQVVGRDKFIQKTPIELEYDTHPLLKVGLFHPESVSHVLWEVVSLSLILYQAASVPFNLGFSIEVSGGVAYFEFVVTLFFIGDICRL